MSDFLEKEIIIIGGGAAGFFAANIIAEIAPQHKILILEQGKETLQKVKVSGGGRCNVTNAVIERKKLAEYYPRGWKLLRKLYAHFNNQDLIKWFENKGVPLKTEPDNRMFPVSNSSSSIMNALQTVLELPNVSLKTSCKVKDFNTANNKWIVHTQTNESFTSDAILLATGSGNFIYQLLAKKEIKIAPPLPSLFTFNIQHDKRIQDLSGLAVQNASVKITGSKTISYGPILITHWGLSGPAILKLSAWAAEDLYANKYKFTIAINWTDISYDETRKELFSIREKSPNKLVANSASFGIPKRLWRSLATHAGIKESDNWKDISKKKMNAFIMQLQNGLFEVNGKSTFKEEFVTCGGVDLQQVNSKTLEHKQLKGLFFAGEVLNIDAVTGGFNFQSAWTTAYVAAIAMV